MQNKMKKKVKFVLGALVVTTMLVINMNLVMNYQKLDISLNGLSNLAQAHSEFDPCPVDPIPWHCAGNLNIFPECFWTNQCITICIGGC